MSKRREIYLAIARPVTDHRQAIRTRSGHPGITSALHHPRPSNHPGTVHHPLTTIHAGAPSRPPQPSTGSRQSNHPPDPPSNHHAGHDHPPHAQGICQTIGRTPPHHTASWNGGRLDPLGGRARAHGPNRRFWSVRLWSFMPETAHRPRKVYAHTMSEQGKRSKRRARHCGVCKARLPVDGRWWRKFCSRRCQAVSTNAARRKRDPGYSARKAREWRANPPPRTEEQIAADRARRAANERRRRARLLEGDPVRFEVTSTGQTGTVKSTWQDWDTGYRMARVLLDGSNDEIEIRMSEPRRIISPGNTIRGGKS